MRSEWTRRFEDARVARDADQAEFRAMRAAAVPIDEGVRDDYTAGILEESDGDGATALDRYASRDRIVENAVGSAADEIERRARLLKGAYPFRVSGSSLVYRRSTNLVYEFCLAVSVQRDLARKPHNELPPEFERLARDVVKHFVGEGADALRTGWPFDLPEDAPRRISSIVKIMNDKTGEWRWQPTGDRPDDPHPKHIKDAGIDFAVWKRAPDRRSGALFVLGQCACGDDWHTKFDDLSTTELGHWFRPITVAPFLKAFAVPFHISNSAHWDDANARGGLLFDRARIALIAAQGGLRSDLSEVQAIDRLIQIVAPEK